MASHGVLRTQPNVGKTAQSREKELQTINEYKALVDQVAAAISRKEYTHTSLDLTSKLLSMNPEYYTIWNHRRRILGALFAGDEASAQDAITSNIESLITTDLQFLLPLLMQYPKCYWIWNQRRWLLDQSSLHLPLDITIRLWNYELGLVGKMHARDSRNFHGWDYRRIVVEQLRKLNEAKRLEISGAEALHESSIATDLSMTESEYSYTTKMIKSNLSNFSAWHNRSKLIPRLLNERNAADEARRKMFDDENALIQSALFIDPYDQSLWFYHQFLMSELFSPSNADSFVRFMATECCEHLEREIMEIGELLEDTNDCKWIYQHLLLYTAKYVQIGESKKMVSSAELRSFLSRLMELDSLRKCRWEDLAETLQLDLQ